MYRQFGKRCFDLIVACSLLILLSPVVLFTAIFVRWRCGSPILFQQKRAGKGGELFSVQKFRTMTNGCDGEGNLLLILYPGGRLIEHTYDSLDRLDLVYEGNEDYAVFPAQCTSELPFPGSASFGVAFALAGPLRSIYATLIDEWVGADHVPTVDRLNGVVPVAGLNRVVAALSVYKDGNALHDLAVDSLGPGRVR